MVSLWVLLIVVWFSVAGGLWAVTFVNWLFVLIHNCEGGLWLRNEH